MTAPEWSPRILARVDGEGFPFALEALEPEAHGLGRATLSAAEALAGWDDLEGVTDDAGDALEAPAPDAAPLRILARWEPVTFAPVAAYADGSGLYRWEADAARAVLRCRFAGEVSTFRLERAAEPREPLAWSDAYLAEGFAWLEDGDGEPYGAPLVNLEGVTYAAHLAAYAVDADAEPEGWA